MYILLQIHFIYLTFIYEDKIIFKYISFLVILIIFDFFYIYFHNKIKYEKIIFLVFFFFNNLWKSSIAQKQSLIWFINTTHQDRPIG